MPNINAVVNEQIRRLARREIRTEYEDRPEEKATGVRAAATLPRLAVDGSTFAAVCHFELTSLPRDMTTASPEAIQNARLRIDGLKGHRARLGLLHERHSCA